MKEIQPVNLHTEELRNGKLSKLKQFGAHQRSNANNKVSDILNKFFSSTRRLLIETAMKETKKDTVKKIKFEHRDISKLVEHFGVSGLSGFLQKEQ